MFPTNMEYFSDTDQQREVHSNSRMMQEEFLKKYYFDKNGNIKFQQINRSDSSDKQMHMAKFGSSLIDTCNQSENMLDTQRAIPLELNTASNYERSPSRANNTTFNIKKASEQSVYEPKNRKILGIGDIIVDKRVIKQH